MISKKVGNKNLASLGGFQSCSLLLLIIAFIVFCQQLDSAGLIVMVSNP